MDIVLIIGRVLFALLFINSGLAHFTQRDAMTGYAQFKKVPSATKRPPSRIMNPDRRTINFAAGTFLNCA